MTSAYPRIEVGTGDELRSAEKFGAGEALFAVELNFEEFKPGVLGAGCQQTMILDDNVAGFSRSWYGEGGWICDRHAMDDELSTFEHGECAGPGLEASPAISEFGRGAGGEIHAAVFTIEQWGKGGPCVILGLGSDGAIEQACESFDHHGRAPFCQFFEEIGGGLIGANSQGLLKQGQAGVEAFFEQHRGVPGECLAPGYGPLDGSGATIFREQGRMQVDAAEARQSQHPRGDDATVGHDNDG